MTFDQFLVSDVVRNSHVTHPDFRTLYVRKGNLGVSLGRYRDSFVRLEKTVSLARIAARRPGSGAFTRLVDRLMGIYDVPVFVECVLDPRFADHLDRAGWTRAGGDPVAPSFLIHWEGKSVSEFSHPFQCPRIEPLAVNAG